MTKKYDPCEFANVESARDQTTLSADDNQRLLGPRRRRSVRLSLLERQVMDGMVCSKIEPTIPNLR